MRTFWMCGMTQRCSMAWISVSMWLIWWALPRWQVVYYSGLITRLFTLNQENFALSANFVTQQLPPGLIQTNEIFHLVISLILFICRRFGHLLRQTSPGQCCNHGYIQFTNRHCDAQAECKNTARRGKECYFEKDDAYSGKIYSL